MHGTHNDPLILRKFLGDFVIPQAVDYDITSGFIPFTEYERIETYKKLECKNIEWFKFDMGSPKGLQDVPFSVTEPPKKKVRHQGPDN